MLIGSTSIDSATARENRTALISRHPFGLRNSVVRLDRPNAYPSRFGNRIPAPPPFPGMASRPGVIVGRTLLIVLAAIRGSLIARP